MKCSNLIPASNGRTFSFLDAFNIAALVICNDSLVRLPFEDFFRASSMVRSAILEIFTITEPVVDVLVVLAWRLLVVLVDSTLDASGVLGLRLGWIFFQCAAPAH